MAHKHKKANRKPITQVSPIAYFSRDPEPMPAWLKEHKEGQKIQLSQFLSSRIIYYPGAGTDGSPIRLFNTAQAAHIFIYADYGYEKEKMDSLLSDNAFSGYHLHHEQALSQEDLSPHPPRYHITEAERRAAISGYDMSIRPQDGFALLKIYERNEDVGEDHGAQRFAVLYIGGDANATYDVLFGNTNRTPYACVVCANMGSGYTCFVRDSLLELIAERTSRFPKYLICMQSYGWNGYQMLQTVRPIPVGGVKRFVWTNGNETANLDKADRLL